MSITVGDLYMNRKSGQMVRVVEVKKLGVKTAYLNNRPGIYIKYTSLKKLYVPQNDENVRRLVRENNSRFSSQERIDEEFVRRFVAKHKGG